VKPTPAQRALLRDLDGPERYAAWAAGRIGVVDPAVSYCIGWHGVTTRDVCDRRGWVANDGGIVRLTDAGRRALGERT